MKKKRLIPVLLLRNGWLVQSKNFSRYQNLGNPTFAVKRLSEWASDELIYLDISKEDYYDIRREDQGYPNRNSILEIIKDVSKVAFMPIAVGGRINSLSDIEERLLAGADKVTINTKAMEDINFIKSAAKEFGSQCIVVSIDVKMENNHYRVMAEGGRIPTDYNPVGWSKIVETQGAGEIFLNSIDRDGMKNGYDISLIKMVAENINIPVIACGGAGRWEHFEEAFEKTKVDGVAAANMFHHSDQSVYLAKKFLYEKRHKMRPPELITVDEGV
jgi:cyclase